MKRIIRVGTCAGGLTGHSFAQALAGIKPAQPTLVTLDRDILIRAAEMLHAGRDYATIMLKEHDAALGRTTPKNRNWAEIIEKDIGLFKQALANLQPYMPTRPEPAP